MNFKQLKLSVFFLVLLFTFYSCSDSGDEPDPCQSGPEISIDNILASIEGKSTGEIVASASSGGTNMFSIDGTNFQSSGTFSGLAGGEYTVVVQDENGCTDSEMATVESITEVFFSNQIKPIIDTNCQISNCHGSNPNIPTYATYNDVKAKAFEIKQRTGSKSMPPTGPLSDSDIQLIADWVDIGAPNN